MPLRERGAQMKVHRTENRSQDRVGDSSQRQQAKDEEPH